MDGVYLQARVEENAECILVIIGATPEGKKELIGFQVGMCESTQSPLSHMQACVAGRRDMNC
jgi:transposase-like protein